MEIMPKCQTCGKAMEPIVTHDWGTEYWCPNCGTICYDAFECGNLKWKVPNKIKT